jgi:hypothetical protein
MRFKKFTWIFAVLLMAAALASCNLGKAPGPTPDVNGIYTSAAQTMVAGLKSQQTQTAQAAPQVTATSLPSLTPLPTFAISTGAGSFGTPFGTPFVLGTPLATLPSGTGVYSFPVGCADATFIGETAPKDGTSMANGKVFTKGWTMFNSGTCRWDEGFSFSFKSGDQMQGENIVIGKSTSALKNFVAVGEKFTFSVQMQVPFKQGEYKGYWQMKDDTGHWFGSIVFVDIVVGQPRGVPSATATNTH